MKKKIFHEENLGYLFVLPALIFMVAIIGYPILYNFILSFQKVDVMTVGNSVREFVGFKNYTEVLKDPMLILTMRHTFFYTVMSIAFQFVLGFGFALFFNLNFRLSKFIRGLVMITWLMPITITGLSFKFMFSPSGGIINELLMRMNMLEKPMEWLLNGPSAMWSLIITNIWIGVPFNMILLTTGLSTISPSLYESASIDGAGWFSKLFHITIPSIRPAILSVLTLGFIYTFKVFDLVFVVTGGGPVNATEVLSTFSYRKSFSEFNFSTGATVANILFFILFLISIIYLRFVQEDEVM